MKGDPKKSSSRSPFNDMSQPQVQHFQSTVYLSLLAYTTSTYVALMVIRIKTSIEKLDIKTIIRQTKAVQGNKDYKERRKLQKELIIIFRDMVKILQLLK